jgi:hypothetical protein
MQHQIQPGHRKKGLWIKWYLILEPWRSLRRRYGAIYHERKLLILINVQGYCWLLPFVLLKVFEMILPWQVSVKIQPIYKGMIAAGFDVWWRFHFCVLNNMMQNFSQQMAICY